MPEKGELAVTTLEEALEVMAKDAEKMEEMGKTISSQRHTINRLQDRIVSLRRNNQRLERWD